MLFWTIFFHLAVNLSQVYLISCFPAHSVTPRGNDITHTHTHTHTHTPHNHTHTQPHTHTHTQNILCFLCCSVRLFSPLCDLTAVPLPCSALMWSTSLGFLAAPPLCVLIWSVTQRVRNTGMLMWTVNCEVICEHTCREKWTLVFVLMRKYINPLLSFKCWQMNKNPQLMLWL